jgi:hypothetical protein
MLIRSKFHDYYDTVASSGVDHETLYIRTTSIVRIPRVEELPYDYEFESRVKRLRVTLNLRTKVIFTLVGFCGKVYPCAKVEIKRREEPSVLLETHFCYSFEDLTQLCDLLNHEILFESIHRWSRHADQSKFFEADYSKWLPAFHAHRAPAFLIHETSEDHKRVWQFVVNPNLGLLRFQSVKDPYSAFQEIYSFISGVLGTTENRMMTISDKEMAKKRGHDHKYSFKTEPGQKKRKRKEKA